MSDFYEIIFAICVLVVGVSVWGIGGKIAQIDSIYSVGDVVKYQDTFQL